MRVEGGEKFFNVELVFYNYNLVSIFPNSMEYSINIPQPFGIYKKKLPNYFRNIKIFVLWNVPLEYFIVILIKHSHNFPFKYS